MTMEAICSRRSIRVFQPEAVPPETVHELLRAGFHAPSAHHLRPWHFIAVNDRSVLSGMIAIHSNMSMLKTAPLAIVVCGDSAKSPDFWPDDCAAASENIIVAAQSMGLGSFWCAVYPRIERMESFKSLLGLPDEIKPYSVLALGKPAEEKRQMDRFNQARVHYNIW